MRGIAPQPHRPQPIDVAVMQPEQWIEPRGVERPHESADGHVHRAVRRHFDLADGVAAAVIEARLRSAESGIAARPLCDKRRFRETVVDVDVELVGDDLTAVGSRGFARQRAGMGSWSGVSVARNAGGTRRASGLLLSL